MPQTVEALPDGLQCHSAFPEHLTTAPLISKPSRPRETEETLAFHAFAPDCNL